MSPLAYPPQRLPSFPEYFLQPIQQLFRIHRSAYGPWWFSSDSPLRFDLSFPSGTCYLAEEDLGAFVEAFQDWTGAILPAAELAARRLSKLSVPHPMKIADCTDARALAFGVTAEIHSSPDRALTQAWATAFARQGFDGVRFLVRHDPAQLRTGIALFGPAGESSWPVRSTTAITPELLMNVEQQFGIKVR